VQNSKEHKAELRQQKGDMLYENTADAPTSVAEAHSFQPSHSATGMCHHMMLISEILYNSSEKYSTDTKERQMGKHYRRNHSKRLAMSKRRVQHVKEGGS